MDGIINKDSFEESYELAKELNLPTFKHNGKLYHVEYSHYLIEYMGILEKQRRERLLLSHF